MEMYYFIETFNFISSDGGRNISSG